jgi:hypothetical protein
MKADDTYSLEKKEITKCALLKFSTALDKSGNTYFRKKHYFTIYNNYKRIYTVCFQSTFTGRNDRKRRV